MYAWMQVHYAFQIGWINSNSNLDWPREGFRQVRLMQNQCHNPVSTLYFAYHQSGLLFYPP